MDYNNCLYKLKKYNWQLDDVFPEDSCLDCSLPFLPDSLTYHHKIDSAVLKPFLLGLNQIMAKSYLNLFVFVEEYIIKSTKQLAQESVKNSAAKDALVLFYEQEMKHQQLFKRFISAFDKRFPITSKVLNCEQEVADIILSKSRIAVLLITLHLEIITQDHYRHAIEKNTDINQTIVTILKSHWVEEAQHANIDFLELLKYIEQSTKDECSLAIDEYSEILEQLHQLLAIQAQYDVASFEAYCNSQFNDQENIELQHIQHLSYSNIFVLRGIENKKMQRIIRQCFPNDTNALNRLANRYTAFIGNYNAK